MLQDQRIWTLISLKLSDEASPDELRELEALLRARPDLIRTVEELQKVWELNGAALPAHAEDAFKRHAGRLESASQADAWKVPAVVTSDRKKVRFASLPYWIGATAAALMLGWFLYQPARFSSPPVKNTVVSTKPGFRATVTLPDGSKVWLNTNTKLTYDGNFEGDTREVFLSGEAYFDVVKDKNRPFLIHTNTIRLQVLGTVFNVRSYDDDRETETSLVTGAVEVTLRNNPDKKIYLKPGERLLVNNEAPVSTSPSVKYAPDSEEPIAVLTKVRHYGLDSSIVETSWTQNQMVFDRESLAEIALKLERWFDVDISIRDERLKAERYTAIFKDESLEEILRALSLAEGFHFVLKERTVRISR